MRGSAALFVAMTVAASIAGSAHGQVAKRDDWPALPHAVQERRAPPARDDKAEPPSGQAKRLRTPAEGAAVLREVLTRRGYEVVRATRDGNVHYVYFQARRGPVRRAAVRPGRDRLIFLDVPQSVLRDVLARLYGRR